MSQYTQHVAIVKRDQHGSSQRSERPQIQVATEVVILYNLDHLKSFSVIVANLQVTLLRTQGDSVPQ